MSLRYSPSVARLTPYVPGLSAQDVASEFGVSPSEVVKLGSEENPFEALPVLEEALALPVITSNSAVLEAIEQFASQPSPSSRWRRSTSCVLLHN